MSEAQFAEKFHRLGFGEFVSRGALWNSCGSVERYLKTMPTKQEQLAFVIGSDGLKSAVRDAGFSIARPKGPTDLNPIPLDLLRL